MTLIPMKIHINLTKSCPLSLSFSTGAAGAHLLLAAPLLGRTHHLPEGEGLHLAIHHTALCCRDRCNVTLGSAELPCSLLLLSLLQGKDEAAQHQCGAGQGGCKGKLGAMGITG